MVTFLPPASMVPCPKMAMSLVWHARPHQEPAHQWLREQLAAVVAPALAGGETRPQAVPRAAR